MCKPTQETAECHFNQRVHVYCVSCGDATNWVGFDRKSDSPFFWIPGSSSGEDGCSCAARGGVPGLVRPVKTQAGVRHRLSHDAERAFGVIAAFKRDDRMESPAPCHVIFRLLFVSNSFERDDSMEFAALAEGVYASPGCQPVDHSPVEDLAYLHRGPAPAEVDMLVRLEPDREPTARVMCERSTTRPTNLSNERPTNKLKVAHEPDNKTLTNLTLKGPRS